MLKGFQGHSIREQIRDVTKCLLLWVLYIQSSVSKTFNAIQRHKFVKASKICLTPLNLDERRDSHTFSECIIMKSCIKALSHDGSHNGLSRVWGPNLCFKTYTYGRFSGRMIIGERCYLRGLVILLQMWKSQPTLEYACNSRSTIVWDKPQNPALQVLKYIQWNLYG